MSIYLDQAAAAYPDREVLDFTVRSWNIPAQIRKRHTGLAMSCAAVSTRPRASFHRPLRTATTAR